MKNYSELLNRAANILGSQGFEIWDDLSNQLRDMALDLNNHVATKRVPDPYDERDGLMFSLNDLRKLKSLPPGTKLYASLPQHKTEIPKDCVPVSVEVLKILKDHVDDNFKPLVLCLIPKVSS